MYQVIERLLKEGPSFTAKEYLLPVLSLTLVVLALALAGLLIRNLVKLVIDRKRGVLGSRLRTKLVFFLLGFVLIPALMMVYGSGVVIKKTVEAIFSTPVERLTQASKEIVDHWNDYLMSNSRKNAERLASAMAQGAFAGLPPEKRAAFLEAWLDGVGLDFAVVLDGSENGVMAIGRSLDLEETVRRDLRKTANALSDRGLAEGGPVAEIGFLGEGLAVLASVPFSVRSAAGQVVGVVTVGLIHPPNTTADMKLINDQAGAFRRFQLERKEFVRIYLMLIGLTLLVTLFLSTWIGFYLSKRITGPINEVAAAAREISAGNLDVRVVDSAGDEVGVLIDAFNDMAAQLEESREVINRSTADLRTTNQALDERRRYIETLVANLSTAVISVDKEGKVTTVNPAVKTILGITVELGESIRSALSAKRFQPLLGMLGKVMELGEEGELAAGQLQFDRPTGLITAAARISPLRGRQGEYLGVLIMLEDLTELQRAQRAAAWREAARRIAHEIKNPLTPIQLSAQRLKKKFLESAPDLDKVVPEATDSIEREVAGLKNLVNEFSRFARMPEVVPQAVDPRDMIESVLALYKGVSGVEWKLEIDPDAGTVRLDPQQMRRVLVNLIDNSLAAMGSRGTVAVRLRRSGSGAFEMEVEDDGPGIPARDLPRLFEPYFSTKPSGTGLGLAMVHRVILEHGGKIRVENGPARGAKFVMEFPASG